MYKLLLSWRYLLTRYLALASIISVMLGVATLIVVNSVMGGFATKLRDRMHSVQAHVLIESRSADGFYDYEGKIRLVEQLLGDKMEAISPVIETFAMLQFKFRKYDEQGNIEAESEPVTRTLRVFGVDPVTKSATGEFAQHLQDKANQENPGKCFQLHGTAEERYRRYHPPQPPWMAAQMGARRDWERQLKESEGQPPPTDPVEVPPEIKPQYGVVLGFGLARFRKPDAKATDEEKDLIVLEPGDEVQITTVSRAELDGHDGTRGYPRPVTTNVVITDLFKCGMSEIDSNVIFMDIHDLQRLRTLTNRATALHIKLKDYDKDAKDVVALLSEKFHPMLFQVETWEKKQGPLLAAISIERSILNILLFLIIAVAGFGILAIFYMIVVEKTRDIGILKALGASNGGVMGIFLSYGLALGLVGGGLGTLMGMAIVININTIEQALTWLTGHEVFERGIYYFDSIPTDMQTSMIVFVNCGAILIAVAASVLPAFRAALLHPVQALRYE